MSCKRHIKLGQVLVWITPGIRGLPEAEGPLLDVLAVQIVLQLQLSTDYKPEKDVCNLIYAKAIVVVGSPCPGPRSLLHQAEAFRFGPRPDTAARLQPGAWVEAERSLHV